jgi:hemerythrin superfamily protein
MTDGLDLLTNDHREVEALFERYRTTRDEPLAREIFDRLTTHAQMEAQALYPDVRRIVDGGDDLVDRAEAEHAAVTALVARALTTPPADLAGLVDRLQHEVAEHVAFEERELFPALRDSGVDADKLGDALERARAAIPDRPAPGLA